MPKIIPEKLNVYVSNSAKSFPKPAFIVDSENKGTNSTAKSWAEGNYGWRNSNPVTPVEPIVIDNLLTNVRINDITYRGQGSGYIFEVVIDDKYIVDLRLPNALKIIKNCDITKGQLQSKFLYIRDGSSFKFIFEGSDDHKEAIKEDNRIASPRVSMKDLKEGHKYSSLSGNEEIYLGKFKHLELQYTIRRQYNYKESKDKIIINDVKVTEKLQRFWTEKPWSWDRKNYHSKQDQLLCSSIKLRKNHNFIHDDGLYEKVDVSNYSNKMKIDWLQDFFVLKRWTKCNDSYYTNFLESLCNIHFRKDEEIKIPKWYISALKDMNLSNYDISFGYDFSERIAPYIDNE